MISANSRYISASVSTVTDDRGTHLSINTPFPGQQTVNYTSYMVQEDDTIDWISYVSLGSPGLWWMISDVNPEILDWTDLAPGTILRIPYAG